MKKFSLFNIVQIALFGLLAIYLTAKLSFGDKGILKFYSLQKTYEENKNTLEFIKKENSKLNKKLELLNEKSVNSMYLEELARTVLEYGKEDEKIVIIEEN
jgi:cell division protein FtsB